MLVKGDHSQVPNGLVEEDEIMIACTLMPMSNKDTTIELLKRQFSNVAIYALLLNSDVKHPICDVMREHWSEIHNLTGANIALVAFAPPADWTESLEEYWKKELGNSFDDVWRNWQKPADMGAALSYLDLFAKPIKTTDLPCLVLFTELDKPEAVLRPLPAWDPDDLYRLLLGLIDDVRDCCASPKEARLECLKNKLSSPGAKTLSYLAHYAGECTEYVKKHPAQIVGTTLSFILALSTNSVLPLGAATIGILDAVRKVSSKS